MEAIDLLRHYINEQLRINNLHECQAKWMLELVDRIEERD